MGFRGWNGGSVEFAQVLPCFVLKTHKTLYLLMICPPRQKLLPRTVEGKIEKGMEEE